MNIELLEGITLLTLGIYFVPVGWKQPVSVLLSLGIMLVTGTWAIQVLAYDHVIDQTMNMPFWFNASVLHVDKLSAFFILVIDFGCLTSLLYSSGYLSMYAVTKRPQEFSLHYFFLLWLQLAMILVVTLHEGLPFLVAWEIMSISSFMLVIFETEKKEILSTGIYYLIQMHVALFFVLAAFALIEAKTGISGFDGLTPYFQTHDALPMFLLFFAGFGIKAGFIPLHSWLPHAHPAAPSHVSGVMSGTMIKMGIYGIMRVSLQLTDQWMEIGTIVLMVSIVSSVFGVFFAIFQHDLKKMLAFHSIENIGIIGIGIGTGLIGTAMHMPVITVLGFSGALLHVANHSLFKSLLFYCAGSVYQQCHTRDVNELGGLIKKMPQTAMLFLLASTAICGLPPLNGFISEFLIYKAFFTGLGHDIYTSVLFLSALIGLTLTGGLAVFCFTKAFGVVFLGAARSHHTEEAHEVSAGMRIPKYLIAVPIVGIGLGSYLLMPWLQPIAAMYLKEPATEPLQMTGPMLQSVSLALGAFVVLVLVVWFIRRMQQSRKVITYGPTWGCGYSALTPEHQYTSTSFADNLGRMTSVFTGVKTHYHPIDKADIFPSDKRKYETHQEDELEKMLILRPSHFFLDIMLRFTGLRSGKIQHYILYGLGFIILIALLTVTNLL